METKDKPEPTDPEKSYSVNNKSRTSTFSNNALLYTKRFLPGWHHQNTQYC